MSLDRVRAAENGMRYELWESRTGGESWNVRQVDSRPVPFKKPAREPLVRIRPDRSGKTNHVERRQGDRWTLLASFDVSAGECKPLVPEPAPPASQPETTSAKP
jgi:hypothetical protein